MTAAPTETDSDMVEPAASVMATVAVPLASGVKVSKDPLTVAVKMDSLLLPTT